MKAQSNVPSGPSPQLVRLSSMSTKQTYPTTIVPVISGWIMHT